MAVHIKQSFLWTPEQLVVIRQLICVLSKQCEALNSYLIQWIFIDTAQLGWLLVPGEYRLLLNQAVIGRTNIYKSK
jgi:hypothetical protein